MAGWLLFAAVLYVWCCTTSLAQTPQQDAKLQDHLVFIKFFKVGGTTVADVLGRLAMRDGRKICCGQIGCDVCYTHNTLDAWKRKGRSAFPPHSIITTLLRDPVERELSRYFYDRARGERRASQTSLDVWVLQAPNDYTRVLGNGRVDAAKRTLDDHFALVGVTERLHDFLVMLGLQLDQTPASMAYRSLKKVVGRPTQDDVSKRAVDTLRRRLANDIEVYEHAVGLFEHLWNTSWPQKVRDRYVVELENAKPNVTCTFKEHKGAVKLHGKDCLQVRP